MAKDIKITKEGLQKLKDELDYLKVEGRAEGKTEGINERNFEIAKNMLSKAMEVELISEITGLSIEEIKNLK